MAFVDVIDKSNVDQCLLAVIRPKKRVSSTMTYGDKLYISERDITCATFVPGDSGNYHFNPIVRAWGEFGYVGEADLELVVSDGSVLLQNARAFGTYGSLGYLLGRYELQGASIWIGQMLVEVVAGSKICRTALIFSGVINEVGNIKRESVELQFADHTATTPIIPFKEVTRVDFDDAPEESIGAPIPIVMGDFSEVACSYTGMDSEDLQDVGLGNLAGVPAIIVTKNLAVYDEGPDYRISDHIIKELDTDAGVTLLEPEEEVPGRVHPSDWALVNSAYAGIETDWPMRVEFPVRPDGRGLPYTTGLNHMLACDADLSTYVALGNDPGFAGFCTLVLRNVSNLGKIQKIQCCAWVFDGSGTVRLALTKNQVSVGSTPSTDIPLTGNEQICVHTVTMTNGWPTGEWNFDPYCIEFQLPVDTYVAKIREMWLRVTYVPNRAQREKKRYHYFGKPGGLGISIPSRLPPANKDLWWPAHGPTVLTYSKGIKDDGSGTYTGTANALIENGADMARYFAVNYMGLSSSQVESGTAIGNFGTARTDLGTHHKLAMYLGDKLESRDQYELLCRECRAMPVWNADGKLGMVPIKANPANNYRSTSDVFDWEPRLHFYQDTFRCWRTPLDQLANRVFIDFDYCHATGKFRKTAFVTPDETDNGFGTDDDSGRKLLAGMAEDFFGPGREFRLRAYDVRKQGVAKALRNFFADNLRYPRVWFDFECGPHACDLSVGNVMHFGVELINGMQVPTYFNTYTAAEYWDDFYWYVAGVTRLEQEGDVSRYLVRGFEAFITGTPSTWVAAADD